ncbi:MAG: protein kinase, partial [Candidatus Marinimicrobia bacterium]|nr:protein kinase [Candidatus Neomarinimicrobiota bacterium]
GGMGIVYKAEDTKLKRTVALKFLTPQALGTEEEKTRFVHEAQAAAALDHPNICTIYEIDEADEKTFIAMAHIDGQSLKDKIESGPLKLEDALDIGIQVAEGLQEAHEKGIVHRDIKSANIMMTEKGQAKIMDFGLAKLASSPGVTKEGTTMGTAAYMSPEQARGEGVDHRTDIWSLGVVLYEMITGKLPFRGEYELAVVYSILNEDPEPITGLRMGVPMELDRIVTKTLAKNPDERYQHVDELIVDLHQLKKGSKPVVIPSKKVFRLENLRKRLKSFTVWGILLLAVILGVIYLVIPKEQEVPSVGILYMENLGDEENEFWARGITEDVINTVASAGLIRVSSMQDVVDVVGLNMPLFDIARKLRVKYLLTSSIYKRDDAFDLSCQLIEAETGRSMYNKRWSEPVERASTISRTVAKDILNNLDVSSKPYGTKYVTVNPEAYELYLRGKYRWEKRQNQQDREVARGLLNKAIELDQNLIIAKVMLGQSFRETGDYERATDIFRECLVESERIGDRASQALSIKNMADIY